jgi:hypothetical protein
MIDQELTLRRGNFIEMGMAQEAMIVMTII